MPLKLIEQKIFECSKLDFTFNDQENSQTLDARSDITFIDSDLDQPCSDARKELATYEEVHE